MALTVIHEGPPAQRASLTVLYARPGSRRPARLNAEDLAEELQPLRDALIAGASLERAPAAPLGVWARLWRWSNPAVPPEVYRRAPEQSTHA